MFLGDSLNKNIPIAWVRACVCVCVRVCVCLCINKCDKSKQCYDYHMYNTISCIDDVSKVHELKI